VANRYWVGGTATWDGTALLKWSTTSGGVGGSAVPTTSDTVFFDAASGAGTVTLGTTGACSTINFTGFTGTFAWGTNTITVAGSGLTVYTQTTSSTFTGTPVLNFTYSGSTGTRTINCGSVTEANSATLNISAGGDTVTFQAASGIKNLNFTGFTGALSSSTTRTIYGNLTISTGMSLTAGNSVTTFAATSGTQTITSNAKTMDFPVTINGVGGTVQLVDALTMGSSRTLTLTNGTFNSNAKSVTTGVFAINNTNIKTLTLTNSTVTITNGTTSTGFFVTTTNTTATFTGSNIVFTTSGVANIFVSSTLLTIPQVTMSGSGQLILGTNGASIAMTTLSNTVSPCIISINNLANNTTVTNFNLSGTAGNLVTFNTTTAGTSRPIIKSTGTVNALYLNIQDSTASGGAKWYANSSNDLGNNTGWNIFNNSFLAVF
jgi:hypothetical protein